MNIRATRERSRKHAGGGFASTEAGRVLVGADGSVGAGLVAASLRRFFSLKPVPR